MQVRAHEYRSRVLRWVDVALDAVNPERRVADALQACSQRNTAMLALGKAAAGMARGAAAVLGNDIVQALVIAPPSPATASLPPRWQFIPGDHPLPGENSLAAGKAMAAWLHALEPGLPLLVLLSGGGSALAELPVTGMPLAELRRMNRWLLGSGLDIRDINAVRGRFSMLKRGGLLRFAGERDILGLLVSDVPGDAVSAIASGPLSPDVQHWPASGLPAWLEDLHAALPMAPGGTPLSCPELRVAARNGDALDAVAQALCTEDISLLARSTLAGSAEEAGYAVGARLLESAPGVHLFGGETTVRLPADAGRGGRNQHLALAAARHIAGRDDIFLLALGTDGIDGNTEDAGALVDGGSWRRITDAGLDPVACLAGADSNTALAASGDVINTGATGTNVMDVVIAWKTA